jgi:hypothetical protein
MTEFAGGEHTRGALSVLIENTSRRNPHGGCISESIIIMIIIIIIITT